MNRLFAYECALQCTPLNTTRHCPVRAVRQAGSDREVVSGDSGISMDQAVGPRTCYMYPPLKSDTVLCRGPQHLEGK